MTATDAARLAQIRETYADLAGWRARVKKSPPEQPQRGSELAADDAYFEWHPISEAARISLALAGEHLRLAATALEAGEAYPSAHFTVLRGALVGAAQGVWVLAPDDSKERQARGHTLIAEMYDRLRESYVEMGKDDLTALERQQLDGQLKWCDTRREQIAAIRPTKDRINQTKMIAWAIDHKFPEEAQRVAGRFLWRQLSSDAHVLGWGMIQRGGVLRPDGRSKLGVGESSVSLEHFADAFLACHRLLREGWSLFDRRCEA